MLYLHETHEIVGAQADAFEELLRTRWVALIERRRTAKLLWYWHHTHGTGPSYQAVSITAVRDWTAWGELVHDAAHDAGWRDWYADVWKCRRELTSKILVPTAWSPLQEIDLQGDGARATADLSLYLHDTGWPFPGHLDAYTHALGSVFYPATRKSRMIEVAACWTVSPGTGHFHEVVLLQRILDWEQFSHLLCSGERPSRPGEWMQEGLKYRDRWESKLLRPASWSPWK